MKLICDVVVNALFLVNAIGAFGTVALTAEPAIAEAGPEPTESNAITYTLMLVPYVRRYGLACRMLIGMTQLAD